MSKPHPMRLCIHGHFYQPPRENPWTGELEAQESALPHHDWNERISRECYAPNGASRLLDAKGRIRGLVNNYRWMSFNFGPTLLEWMDSHDPETLERIKEADRLSREDQDGHGNALAQVYNHIIMPLGTDRDRRTQVSWGAREFEDRFGRRPEGMWLAETAIDMATVVALIEGGIRFTVLAPTQADKFRPLGSDSWTDVSDNTIDPSRPYRIFPLDALGEPLCAGHLDVFFYDGPISSAVGFEHLLRDAGVYHERLKAAWNPDGGVPKLVSVGTDGESYGHHEPFGDMALAYLFDSLAPRDGIVPCNFGHFLSLRPPVEEVRLKNVHGDGTAWSCAHGTDRWKSDCGCSTGGGPGWNQAWRTPLRQAMDLARERAESAWDALAPFLFADPWKARVEWISTRTGAIRQSEWEHSHLRPEAAARGSEAARLMELVRMGQFSLTSCAWFFDDLGGLEPVQNLRYALRVCELLVELGKPSPEAEIRKILAGARSNVEGRTGDWIWDHWVRPALAPSRRTVAQAAVRLLMGAATEELHGIRVLDSRACGPEAILARLEWMDPVTRRPSIFRSLAQARDGGSSRAWVLPGDGDFPSHLDADGDLRESGALEIDWGGEAIEASDFDLDTRRALSEARIRRAMEGVRSDLESLDQHTMLARADLHSLHTVVPQHLSFARRILLEEELASAVLGVLEDPTLPLVERIRAILREARTEGIELRLPLPDRHYDRKLQELMARIWSHPEPSGVATLILLLDLAEQAKFPVSKAPLENLASRLRTEDLHPLLRRSTIAPADTAHAALWVSILERLNFDMDLERELLGIPSGTTVADLTAPRTIPE
jgi:hypothetical protein